MWISSMSPRRDVPRLIDLCFQSVTENIIYHSEMYKMFSYDRKIMSRYITFQYLFGDAVLKKICDTHFSDKTGDVSEMKCFSNFLFRGKKWGTKNLETCLGFIVNKHVKKIRMHCTYCDRRKIPEEITSHILSTCKDVEDLDLQCCYLNEAHFLKAVLQFSKLVKLDLSNGSCTDPMVCKIWENLPDLQELSVLGCSKISDKCLEYLCKISRYKPNAYRLCEAGSCWNLGMKLKVLDLRETNIKYPGILNALVHLKSLEFIDDTKLGDHLGTVAGSIRTAQVDFRESRQSLDSLMLKSMRFPRYFRPFEFQKVLDNCPHLEEVDLRASMKNLRMLARRSPGSIKNMFMHFPLTRNLDSSIFRDFLFKWGDQLKSLTIGVERTDLKIQHIIQILKECTNLMEFSIEGALYVSGANDGIPEMPTCIEKLLVLDLRGILEVRKSLMGLFFDVLSRILNLKILELSGDFAKDILSRVSEIRTFNSVEIIVLTYVDLRNISLVSLMNEENYLKKVILSRCENTERFLEIHRDISKKNNFLLDIECWAPRNLSSLRLKSYLRSRS